ncbi:DUF929 domain-containing protein [Sulfurisphaera ohwakuensis]|uniref:DUF929 domain-containing protein n=1 Tax=Sulfurisphaera ohwakuensis TaxID=69656 RepID=A0A650CHW5_SULOH|nr:DUF929 domain-containing protein [Sulfurisphaera ohwakuensis]MBB5253531.1 hypothetical protein [Sulfurisphaera ohwakuensis]QGR17444.1 DUF929 domain-containing protein [Sulfurisphaera ohwakuensis]
MDMKEGLKSKMVITAILVFIIAAAIPVYLRAQVNQVQNNAVPPLYATVPVGKFFYASPEDFAPPHQVDVYLIGWEGCHVALSDAWPLYVIMSAYGSLSYVYASSNPYRPFPNTTGLIFLNYTPYEPDEPVHFYFIYMYNKWLNATPNGTPIPKGELITVGAEELKHFLPTPLYQLVMHYQLDAIFQNTSEPLAILKGHIVTVLVITGPNGTYMAYGPLYNILPLKNANGTYIMQNLYNNKVVPYIWQGVQIIENVIEEAAGSQLNITFT